MRHRSILLFFIVLSGFLGVVAPLEASRSGEAQDEAGKAYREAHKLILDEKFPAAIQALETFIQKYRSSDWSDDARFWICFAREKTEPSAEKAFDCYQKFVQSNPKSEWINDAKMNMVQIAHQLAKEGKPEYGQQVRSFAAKGEGEIEMAVFAALLDIGDEGALARVMERVDRIANEELRSRVVRMLGEHGESPAVVRKLSDLARKDASGRVRESAIRALGETQSGEALAVLREIAQSGDAPEVRKRAIRALGEMESHAEVLPLLKKIAETDSNVELAVAAVQALGEIPGRGALEALQGIYAQARSQEVRRAVVRAVAERGEEEKEGIQFLLKVASGDTSPEVRRSAVSSIAEVGTAEALSALKDIAASNRETEVREAALRAIGEHPGEGNVEVLAALLKSEKDPRLRKAAVNGLAETGKDSAVAVLAQAAKTDADTEVRKTAVRALGEIGSPAAREALIGLLK
jgi:HEAT repeat protein